MSASLKLPDDMQERVARAAEADGKSPETYMLEAIERELERAEKRRAFIEAALRSEEETERTGMGYEARETMDYFRALARGENPPQPKARPWRT